MKTLHTLLSKEIRALFSSPIAYIAIAVFLLLLGYTFTAFLFLNKTATLVHIFFQAAVLFLLMVPVLTMRQFAEERKTGTLELLLTAPVREATIVLAKFLACMAVNAVILVLSLTYAWVLQAYGAPDWGPVYSGYLGLLLFTASLVALGLTVSACTANQIVAATVSLGVFLVLWMIDTLGSLLPAPFDNLVTGVSLLAHFTPFATGALYLSDVGFFLSVMLLGLFLSVRALHAGDRMEPHDPQAFANLWWFLGWGIALGVLFALGLRLPLQPQRSRWGGPVYTAGVVLGAVVLVILGNIALAGRDAHFDLTREKVFTPSRQALEVVDRLSQDVQLTYFYQGQDQHGKRLKELVEVLGRRNPHLRVRTIDPDTQPSLAKTSGVRLYNAAVLEAEGRRVVVQSTDENELALGIQQVVRERVITICFLTGHNEYPIDNFEFHTHLEGVHDHSHGDATSKVVQMPGHGIGRLRHALEALGFVVRPLLLAVQPEIPPQCTVAVAANPRTTYLPGESAALAAYLGQGGALLLMYDLGFVIEPRLAQVLETLGVRLTQQVIVDPQQHYATDPEMLAVTGLEPHAITKNVAMTFFPGARALELLPPQPGITTVPLIFSSTASYTQPVAPVDTRQVALDMASASPSAATPAGSAPPHLLAVASEGVWPGTEQQAPPFRVVVIGDADFASNSFFPYLANSDLSLAMIRWLVREERAPAVAPRIPVPPHVVLTKAHMQRIFLVTEVLLPLGVLLIGTLVWWRRR